MEGRRRKKGCWEEIGKRNMTRGRPACHNELDAERLNPLLFLRKAGAEIAIVIRPRACRIALRRIEEAPGTVELKRAISGSEIDPDANENGIRSGAIVPGGLLSAVADAMEARPLHELRIGRVDLDFGDVRAGLGRRKDPEIGTKKVGGGLIVALAEKVGVANVFVGERRLESGGKRHKHQACSKNRDIAAEGLGHDVPPTQWTYEHDNPVSLRTRTF